MQAISSADPARVDCVTRQTPDRKPESETSALRSSIRFMAL